jgi:hypothetical protein
MVLILLTKIFTSNYLIFNLSATLYLKGIFHYNFNILVNHRQREEYPLKVIFHCSRYNDRQLSECPESHNKGRMLDAAINEDMLRVQV